MNHPAAPNPNDESAGAFRARGDVYDGATRRAARRRIVGLCMACFGAALLIIALLGHYTRLGAYPSGPALEWERLDMELVASTPSLRDLYAAAEREAGKPLRDLHPQEAMLTLLDVVARRFSHYDETRHNIFSNWIIWTVDLPLRPFFPVFGKVHSPDLILRHGHSCHCGQQSFTLVSLAKMAGILARHTSLHGHIVMEAWYDDEWRMFDPDYEVAGGIPPEPILGVELLARQPEKLATLYAGKVEPDYIAQTFDRRYITAISNPPWSPWLWKGHVLLGVERAAEVLKFAIPVLLVATGWSLRRRAAPPR